MAKAKKPTKKKNRWLMLIISFMACLLLSVIGGYFALLYAGEQMIDMSKLDELKKNASVVYDKNAQPVFTLYVKEDRDYVPYNKIPKRIIEAFVAVEDKRFFEHNGVDFVRIGGAILKDIQSGSAKEGGSTITQQLARQVFLSDEKTFWRKTKEVSIAINLDQKYTKEQILEMYLNKIYMGEGAYGIEAASKVYFGKSITDQKDPITIAEAAALAATPKAPSYYAPFGDPALAKERRDTVIRLMYEQKLITLEEKEAAQKEPMPVRREVAGNTNNDAYRAYMDYVIREAEEKYGIEEAMLYKGGWKIYTAMDKQMQDAMIAAFKNPQNFPKDGGKMPVQAAMVAIDPKTGGIAGMMGGRDYVAKGFNYAVNAQRQPGSSFKPLVAYAPALDTDGKWNINSSLSNEYQDFNGYKPRNYNNKYSDRVSMKEALRLSLNVPTVWLLDQIGVKTGIDYVERFGIKLQPEDRNLSIALGGLSKGTSPLKMAQAYSAFPNGGIVSEAHAIVKIQEEQMGILETVQLKQTPVLKPQTAWDMHTMLRNAVEQGTGKGAKMNRPVAGKTGTTQSGISKSSRDNKDAWFVGYTPEYVGAVWMGFEKEDKQHIMRNGSDLTARLFKTVFTEGLKGRKVTEFNRPQGVEDPEKEEEVAETAPLQLAADMTMDNGELKVILSWIGGEEEYKTYDIYRYVDSIESKELIQGGWTDTIFMDTIDEPISYKYIIVPRNEQGEEGAPSNPAEIDMTRLENLLRDGAEHNSENPEGDGQQPPEEENGEQESDSSGQGDQQGDGENPDETQQQPDTPADGDGQGNENGEGNGEGDGSGTPPWLDLDLPPTEGEPVPEEGSPGNG